MTTEQEQQKSDETTAPKETNTLDEAVRFSWRRVFKRGLQNMKDDVDPAYKGAKMGMYALHSIPTWIRQHKDGVIQSDSWGWAGLTGLLVGGASAVGYFVGTSAGDGFSFTEARAEAIFEITERIINLTVQDW